MKNNIILIGMPGCGKSTGGVVLAKRLGKHFIDTDLIIQDKCGKRLSELIAENGVAGFKEIENKINSEVQADNAVIATGGSAVYGKEAMAHFKEIGTVVYLKLSLRKIRYRLGNLEKRGVVMEKGVSFARLYYERCELYEKYADITIDCDNLRFGAVINNIIEKLSEEEK